MMLRYCLTIAIPFFLAQPVLLFAQGGHNDINFDYQSNKIDLKVNDLTGTQVGLGDFPLSGLFRQFTQQPGFASEFDVGLGVNPLDTIVYNVLDNLLFWNGSGFATPDPLTQIRIDNNRASPDTIVNGSSGHQPGEFDSLPDDGFDSSKNFIAQADDQGSIHDHVDFHLEPNVAPNPPPLPEIGAYGLKLSLSTDATGIADSDPFLAVFNFGLDSAGFEDAIDQFDALLAPDIPGDYDRSGTVDNDDYLLWQLQFGTLPITSGSGADGNNNGVIDAADYTIWLANLGASNLVSSNTVRVPEPSAINIFTSAVCGLLIFVRRRQAYVAYSRSNHTN